MNIKNLHVTEASFQSLAIRSDDLHKLDRVRLHGSRNARRVARGIAIDVSSLVASCARYVIRSTPTGSYTRATNLKKPGLSDVDVVAYILTDRNQNMVESMVEFDRVRKEVSACVKDYLVSHYQEYFQEFSVAFDYPGLCLKLEVKRDRRSYHPWKVDVIFAWDIAAAQNNNVTWSFVAKEFSAFRMFSQKRRHTTSLAEFRNNFVGDLFDDFPRLRSLVRLLKYWNKAIVMKGQDADQVVNGSALELMVVLLFLNRSIPERFDLNRALATCLNTVAYPENVEILYVKKDANLAPPEARPAPPDARQLAALRKEVGPGRLVLVDPFASFNNFACTKKSGWEMLKQSAQRMVQFLRSKGVTAYSLE